MEEMQPVASVWRERIFRYAPLLLWLAVIFYLSSSQGAMSNTSRFVRPFLVWIFPGAPDEMITAYHGYIRKSAHLFEYAVLALLASRASWPSARRTIAEYWQLFAFLVVLGTASLDELNQAYNSSRSGTVYDVLLDCAGGLAMIVVVTIIRLARRDGGT